MDKGKLLRTRLVLDSFKTLVMIGILLCLWLLQFVRNVLVKKFSQLLFGLVI